MGISIPLVILMNNNYIYSGTLDSKPSEIGTQYNIPLNRGHRPRFQKFATLYYQYILNLLEKDNLSTKDKTAEFILSPLFGGSTVCL